MSGGPSGFGPPSTGDIAIFDSNGAGTCTIAAAVTVQAFDCQGGTGNYAGTIAHNAFTITINSSGNGFRLASGMTYTPSAVTSIVAFTNTSGTANLTTAGHALAAVTVNGAGGTVQQQDNLSVNAVASAVITVTTGTLDSNGYTLTACLFPIFTGTSTRAYLGGGTITLGGNIANAAALIGAAVATGLTFTLNSANIVILPPTSQVFYFTLTPASGTTFNNITVNNNSRPCSFYLGGSAFTVGAFTIGSGYDVTIGNNLTCSSFTINGTPTAPTYYGGNIATAAFSLTCSGAATVSWAIIYNMTGLTGTFTGTNSFLLGETSGWSSVTPPASLTAAAIATAVWQDTTAGDFTVAGSPGQTIAGMANVQYTAPAIARVTIGSSSSTTSVITSACTPTGAAANQFANRTLLFDATTTTTALRGQARAISASSNAAAPTLTVTAFTTAPVSGDVGSII